VKRFLILLVAIVPALASCGTGTIVGPLRVEIDIHYSHYVQTAITVPVGRAVTFVIRNGDPIDHEWIVGDAALHERHRTGTEAHHDSRPTEVSIDAQTTRETTVTFSSPGTFLFICHLPGHEAFGMIGALTVTLQP
jgi:uncharacterized cupredoxin-like copper-binding protein